MMTPFSNPNTPAQRHFNMVHTANHIIIENSFGQLKCRFPILRYNVHLKLENILKCIMSCFVLHDIAKLVPIVCFIFISTSIENSIFTQKCLL